MRRFKGLVGAYRALLDGDTPLLIATKNKGYPLLINNR